MKIPVIDLFAGPGGLSEGFSSYMHKTSKNSFNIALSIEKDQVAHKTLKLRSFFRQFKGKKPLEYYKYLRGEIGREKLFALYPKESLRASQEAWCFELGAGNHAAVRKRICSVLGATKKWILIGGPPCQAYSVVGRSRMKSVTPKDFEKDHRHFLYKEYLRILTDHKPPVFVMENVRGLLSSKINGKLIFDKILTDLKSPLKTLGKNNGLKYKIYSLVKDADDVDFEEGKDCLIKAEQYGIPQCRHRLILIGVREDLKVKPVLLKKAPQVVRLKDVICDLPKLRSGLSKGEDSFELWRDAVQAIKNYKWFSIKDRNEAFANNIEVNLNAMKTKRNLGKEFIRFNTHVKYRKDWYEDRNLKGICNHVSRKHIKQDLHRYFYAACFAKWNNKSPQIGDFPREIWPKHRNILKASRGQLFADRFRVQLKDAPATTITSHISKDGHYFIHPDPTQCRSLTVREAARLQTFPDNYFFEGHRTIQYHQVGNAVPPLLANQIAEVVYDIFNQIT